MRGTRLTLTARHVRELFRLDVRLLAVLTDYLLPLWPAPAAAVTSIHRTREEDLAVGGTGVHVAGPPWRAIDVACDSWDDPGVRDAVIAINRDWLYDPERPSLHVAVYTRHGTGPHVHLQVHPRTRRRDEA